MAELALAITGIALAWKGIVDFGHFYAELVDSDTRQRDVLVLKLRSSQLQLKDWGEHWGINRNEGRFHTFEPERKGLIMALIFQLRDSRTRAMATLKKKYNVPADDEQQQEGAASAALSKTVAKTLGFLQRGRLKARWVMFDRDVIQSLVNETNDLHELLNRNSTSSPRFCGTEILLNPTTSLLETRIASLEDHIKQFTAGQDALYRTLRDSDSVDGQTLASYASKSIPSSKQAERIQGLINCSFEQHTDSRAAEYVSDWWNHDHAAIMVLEVPDDADDCTSTTVCTLLYYLVDCHKLIYVFDSHAGSSPAHQFCDMLRALIQSLLCVRDSAFLDDRTIDIAPGFLDGGDDDNSGLSEIPQLTTMFHDLLREVLSNVRERVTVILDGLEVLDLGDNNDLSHLFCIFTEGFHSQCSRPTNLPNPMLKVLLGHRGHATSLYRFDDCVNIKDLTDRGLDVSSVREDLASTLRGIA